MKKLVKQAFTLIELLVVIAIIGILSGLIVVAMSGVTQKASIAKAQVFSNSLKNALLANVVSEWKLDGNANDTWGTNHGTLFGSPVAKSGSDCLYSGCYLFDGADDYINTPYTKVSGDGTITAWFKTIDQTTIVDSLVRPIIIQGTDTGGSSNGLISIFMYCKDTAPYGLLNFRWGDDSHTVDTTSTYLDGNWHFVSMTHSGALFSAYVDGKFINSGAADDTPSISPTFFIGGTSTHSTRKFKGSIDEVRVFDAIMTTSQIKEQYYAGLNRLLVNGEITKEYYVSLLINK